MEKRVFYSGLCLACFFGALLLLLLFSNPNQSGSTKLTSEHSIPLRSENLFGLSISRDGKVWVASSAGILFGENSFAVNFNPIPVAMGKYFYAVWADSSNRIWAAGEKGLILSSSNAGVDWSAQALGEFSLFDLELSNSLHGLAVGEQGRIFRTLDGKTWQEVSLSSDLNLEEVEVIDAKTAWIVGEEGSIFQTVDGGVSWHKKFLPSVRTNFYTVRFLSKKEGWAAGMGGTLLHTTDGGQEWTRVPTGTKATFYSIDFKDNLGVMVGQGGTILVSHNRGQNWESQSLPRHENIDLISVKLLNEENVQPFFWIAGTRGYVRKLKIQNQLLPVTIQSE